MICETSSHVVDNGTRELGTIGVLLGGVATIDGAYVEAAAGGIQCNWAFNP